MTFKQQTSRAFGTLGVAGAAGLLGALAFAAPASAEVVNIPINQGNVPTTAAAFEQSCDQVPDDIAADQDGWVFVLPASAGAEGNFEAVYATYEDASGALHEFNTDDNGGIVDGQGDNKAYIITPAGWTLVDATADVNDPDDGAKFNLTHACAGTPANGGDDEPTPGDEEPTPGAESPTPGDESPTADTTVPGDEVSTTPAAGSTLPTTGTPLTVALVSAAALAAAGAALFFVMRRRRAAENW
ncbi:LPXTG cell wall anchor domain-containing protein [Glycomyces arizonensis]|uniref:LPXTG cell wall anchor domain-containing protein n=1 Tax=Glycomyces arizonensis TaxID=256035 RepID=UPI000419D08E|nr:LPXTG cell wall anchor domain-containing protein [Glycomyces arizonensis]